MHLKLTCEEGVSLKIDLGTLSLRSGTRVEKFRDVREAELAYYICAAAPNLLTYDEIDIQILRPHKVAQQSEANRMQYLHNKMSAIRKRLMKVTGDGEMIRTIRGKGYQLVERWIVQMPDGRAKDLELLKTLRDVLAETVTLANRLEMVEKTIDEEINVLVLSSDGHKDDIKELVSIYQTVTDDLIKSVLADSSRDTFLQCTSLVQLMESYVRISRQGQGIDEETWKRVFRSELEQHFGIFSTMVLSNSSNNHN